MPFCSAKNIGEFVACIFQQHYCSRENKKMQQVKQALHAKYASMLESSGH